MWGGGGHMGVYGGAFGKKTSSVPHDWAEPGRAGAEPGRAVPGEPGWAELCRAEPGRDGRCCVRGVSGWGGGKCSPRGFLGFSTFCLTVQNRICHIYI